MDLLVQLKDLLHHNRSLDISFIPRSVGTQAMRKSLGTLTITRKTHDLAESSWATSAEESPISAASF